MISIISVAGVVSKLKSIENLNAIKFYVCISIDKNTHTYIQMILVHTFLQPQLLSSFFPNRKHCTVIHINKSPFKNLLAY